MSNPRSRGTRSHAFAPPLYDSNNLPTNDPRVVGRLAEMNGLVRDTGYAWTPVGGYTRSVMDYGARGDGVTDDTDAVLATIAAIGAAGGGTVFFPLGRYLISSPLDLTSRKGVILRGAGKGISSSGPSTTIMTTADITMLKIGTSAATASTLNNKVCDLQFFGNSTGSNQHGIVFHGTSEFWTGRNVIEDVSIYNMGGKGVVFTEHAYTNHFYRCWIGQNDSHGVYAITEANSCSFRDCFVGNNGGDGFNLDGTTITFRIQDCDIEANTGAGINITDANCNATQIIGSHFENNGSHNIIDNGAATVYLGGRNQHNSGSLDGFQAAGSGGLVEGVQFAGTQRYSINLSGDKYVGIRNKFAATTTEHIHYGGGAAHLVMNENNQWTQSMTVKNPDGNSSISIDALAGAIGTLSLKKDGTTKFGLQNDANGNFNLVNNGGQAVVKAKVDTQRWYTAALNSAPTDADIPASFISFYLDESGHNLKVRVCYADGTTFKTGTLALV